MKKYVIHYFDRWAEGWYSLPMEFDSEEEANKFLDNPRGWPKEVDSRVLYRAIKDSGIHILLIKP